MERRLFTKMNADIEEIKQMTLDKLNEYNPHHDAKGRFASVGGGGMQTGIKIAIKGSKGANANIVKNISQEKITNIKGGASSMSKTTKTAIKSTPAITHTQSDSKLLARYLLDQHGGSVKNATDYVKEKMGHIGDKNTTMLLANIISSKRGS
jgi:hypothetical protein